MKCAQNLNGEIRKQIFNEYWALASRDRRVQYVCGLVEVESTKTTRKRKEDSKKNQRSNI